jgi:hypothetical protein
MSMMAPATGDDLLLTNALRRSAALVGAAQALAVGLDQLGSIILPPDTSGLVDQAQLRAVASLYLASDIDAAGVLAAAEMLSGLTRGGGPGVSLDLGAAAPLVADFWRHRADRPTPEEREHTFSELFGGVFEDAMLNLCEALYKLDELATNPTYGGVAQQSRVRTTGAHLMETLTHATGVTVFIAQALNDAIKQAIAILAHPDLRHAFGARDLWGTIAGLDRLTKTSRADPRLYVRRGRAGMTVLSWLADAAPHLEDATTLLVGLDHPVIPAAVDWMEAALAIGEAAGGPSAGSVTTAAAPGGASPSALLAA